MSAEPFGDRGVYHIGKNGGLQTGGIGVDEEKQGIVTQQLCGQLDKGEILSSIFQISPLGPLP